MFNPEILFYASSQPLNAPQHRPLYSLLLGCFHTNKMLFFRFTRFKNKTIRNVLEHFKSRTPVKRLLTHDSTHLSLQKNQLKMGKIIIDDVPETTKKQ